MSLTSLGRISILPPSEAEIVVLSNNENVVISYVYSVLSNNNIDTSILQLGRTKEYLAIYVYDDNTAFFRTKLFGRSFNIAFSAPYDFLKPLLRSDPRFSEFASSGKRFFTIPIKSPSDVEQYADFIIPSFHWAYDPLKSIIDNHKKP